MLKSIQAKVTQNLPFSFFKTVRTLINDNEIKTVLDFGCGDGALMNAFNKDRCLIVDGLDLYKPYLSKAKKTGSYRTFFNKDFLLFKPTQKYDLIFASHVIEHISKKDGIALLKKMKKWSKKLVIVMTPYGFCEQHEYDGNKLQEHHSGWFPQDFVKENYSCKIMGLSSLLVKDHGDSWEETALFKFVKKAVSPFFTLPDPYLVCYYISTKR